MTFVLCSWHLAETILKHTKAIKGGKKKTGREKEKSSPVAELIWGRQTREEKNLFFLLLGLC